MKPLSALLGLCKIPRAIPCTAIALLSTGILPATEIYHLDFTDPEVGVYQIIDGDPSRQTSAGSLTDVLLFHATVGGDQIQLPVGIGGPRYELQYDLLTHGLVGSDYAFVMRLDAGLRSLSFHGGLNSIDAYQPSPYINQTLASFSDDRIYRVGIMVDSEADLWSVAIDGVSACTNPLNGNSLQSIRFGLAPWIGGAMNAPATYAAIDNVVLTVVPEPSAAMFLMAGSLAWWWRVRGRIEQ